MYTRKCTVLLALTFKTFFHFSVEYVSYDSHEKDRKSFRIVTTLQQTLIYGILTARHRHTETMVRRSWFDFGRGQNFFPPAKLYRPYMGHILPTIQWVPEALSEALTGRWGEGVVVGA